MTTQKATDLVDGWIREFHLWLKDGGGAAGIHHVPRKALIERIAAVLDESQPEAQPKPKSKPKKSTKAVQNEST